MLQPGGTFIIHALHQCKAYKCGDRMFPGSNLSIDTMHEALLDTGFAPSSIDAQVIPCPDNRIYGYSGILTASGRKALRRRWQRGHKHTSNRRHPASAAFARMPPAPPDRGRAARRAPVSFQMRWITQPSPAAPSAQEPSGMTPPAYQRVA